MKITVEIPDEIVQRLDQTEGNLSRRLLEVIIVDAYSCGKISTAEVRQILQLPSRLTVHAFSKDAAQSNLLDLETTFEQLQEVGF